MASLAFSALAILKVIDDSASTVSMSSRMFRSSSVTSIVGTIPMFSEAGSGDFAGLCRFPFIDSRA